MHALEDEIEELKSVATFTETKDFGPRKGGSRTHEITNWMKTPSSDENSTRNPRKNLPFM